MTSNQTSLQQLMFSLIEIWQASGQSQKTFCQEKDLAYSKFHYWHKKYLEYQTPSSSGEPFVSVTVKKSRALETLPVGVLELVFPDGRRLIFNQAVEAGFLKALLG